uniref:hAT-like transposase RNase-H fold domain-containing protein n=1 Tax=Fagus sylvatica TaxID=28930 RepID=A0A2N9GVG1_FAGSY
MTASKALSGPSLNPQPSSASQPLSLPCRAFTPSQQPPTTHRVTIACSAEFVESTNMMENEEVMGDTSEPVDKVNLVDEDEDDDDLVEVELEDVPVTVGTQKRKAKRRKTSAVWAFFEMLPTKGDNDKPYCKCKKCGDEYLSPGNESEDEYMRRMVKQMLVKFEKYWSEFSVVLTIAVILDPRYKLRFVDFCYQKLYGVSGSYEYLKVREKLFALFEEYVSNVPTPSSTTSKKRGKAIQDLQFKSFSKETIVGGRVIDQFRSALKPDVVETLICSRDWLYGDKELVESQLHDLTEDIVKMDINKENNDEPPSMGSNPTV